MTEEQIIDELLRREGGEKYTNRASDRGGPTKYGITLTTLRRVRGPHVTAEDVKALTEPEAREIYRTLYIRRPGFNQVLDQRLREFLIDYYVNGGPVVKDLQRAVGVDPDGVIGPDTLGRLAAFDAGSVYAAMLRSRLRHYVHLVVGDPAVKRFRVTHGDTQLENLRGWMNRLGEFL